MRLYFRNSAFFVLHTIMGKTKHLRQHLRKIYIYIVWFLLRSNFQTAEGATVSVRILLLKKNTHTHTYVAAFTIVSQI